MTAAALAQRRGKSLSRNTMNSKRMKAICGCLLRAHKVIHSERSHTRPAAGCQAAFRQSAVIAIAALSAAPSALWTERL
jgi:hypothetical protein